MGLERVAYFKATCDSCQRQLKDVKDFIKIPVKKSNEYLAGFGWISIEGEVFCPACHAEHMEDQQQKLKQKEIDALTSDQVIEEIFTNSVDHCQKLITDTIKQFGACPFDPVLSIGEKEFYSCPQCKSVIWDQKDQCCIHCETPMTEISKLLFVQRSKKELHLQITTNDVKDL